MKTLNMTSTRVNRWPRRAAGANRRLALGAQQLLMGLAAFQAARSQKRVAPRKGEK